MWLNLHRNLETNEAVASARRARNGSGVIVRRAPVVTRPRMRCWRAVLSMRAKPRNNRGGLGRYGGVARLESGIEMHATLGRGASAEIE